ncbi:hypothetical protein AVEN_228364-1 [Araneus ventricosus]|uniref:CCHC-type domain-containing protein n=1 Tax=Araneus ventricosus TaxID=182803 RepID=A0A4Y2K7K8_ARAVE|nr:hypothetical protein AVEN_228364-1 [Araneus ventricosus]
MRLSVRPYIPNPLRCFKCQRFGHSQTSCCGTLTRARCAEVGHECTRCTAKEKCVNCKDDHTSFSRNCLAWKLEKEVVATKEKQSVSQSPHLISEHTQVLPLLSTSVVVKNAPIPICDDASTSHDLTGFKTLTEKKKTKTQSEPTNAKQNEFHPESSKFWTTSPLQVSNSTITQVIKSLKSEDALKKLKRANEVRSTHLNPNSESMLVDGSSINKMMMKSSRLQMKMQDYDPNETIEECPPIEEQQTSTHQTSIGKSILKQRLKRNHFDGLILKLFMTLI